MAMYMNATMNTSDPIVAISLQVCPSGQYASIKFLIFLFMPWKKDLPLPEVIVDICFSPESNLKLALAFTVSHDYCSV